jgi:catalase
VPADGASKLSKKPAARDFVSDAFAHDKFIAYVPDAAQLLQVCPPSALMRQI